MFLLFEGFIGYVYDVDFLLDGGSIVVCFYGGYVRCYSVNMGKILIKYEGYVGVLKGVRKVLFYFDGELLALVVEDLILCIWEVESGE